VAAEAAGEVGAAAAEHLGYVEAAGDRQPGARAAAGAADGELGIGGEIDRLVERDPSA
jgi:hypothetical protein